jgi:hypothetical protein
MRLAAAIGILLGLVSCGYVGDPLPPAFHIPRPVTDLRVQQVGSRLEVRFTVPPKTTEDLPVKDLSGAELRIGLNTAGGWNQDAWAASASPVPVQAAQPGPVQAAVPVGDLAGKEIVAGVRLTNARGRVSGWSNLVTLRVERPVPAPASFRADSAPEGIALEWAGASGSVLVFRNEEPMGEASGRGYLDRAVELGKSYFYQVQAKQGMALSDLSAPVKVTFEDRFPPSVPRNLTAIAGAGTIELAWDRSPEADAAGYIVERAAGEEAFAVVAKVDVPAYSDRDVKSGGRYRYRVAAVDVRNNQSSQSQPVEIILP